MDPAALPPEQLLATLTAHLPVDPGQLRWRCPTGRFNTTYFVEGGPRPLVLRVAPPDDPTQVLFYEYRMMRQEPALHALLRARTQVPVPAILAHGLGTGPLGRDYLW